MIKNVEQSAVPMVTIQLLQLRDYSVPSAHAKIMHLPSISVTVMVNQSLFAQITNHLDAQFLVGKRFVFTCQMVSSQLPLLDQHAPSIILRMLKLAVIMVVLIALACFKTPLMSTGKPMGNLAVKMVILIRPHGEHAVARILVSLSIAEKVNFMLQS